MGLFQRKPAADPRWEALNAEYENYRRRTVQELQTAGDRAAQQTAAEFLPLYDDLQRALAAPCSDESCRKGMELIFKNLLATFSKLKIVPMDSKGKIFNPTYHEAVSHITDPKYRKEEITEVLQVGFLMDDEVLRHAKVIVANCE
ncbi:MAG: nucleotide exchange factor GrpE [Oscillospiraceae bacterium]|nr:nucleotide exchange factor GrpE [Oscillospiraceae bacterium]